MTKNEIKYIQSLYHKKQRDEEQVFIAEGPKLAEELLNGQIEVKHIYATEKWLAKNSSVKEAVTGISMIELSRISQLQSPNEVLLIAKQKIQTHEPVLTGKLTIALDGIQDPGNMGTIIRIANWFGVDQLICSSDCVDIYNYKVVQSTMGSILRVNCWYKDFEAWNLPGEIAVYGALLHGRNIYTAERVKEALLVIGNESKGIREPILSKITFPVTIPGTGKAESLNAAVATGIIVGCLVNGH